jgi:hypothetical protein
VREHHTWLGSELVTRAPSVSGAITPSYAMQVDHPERGPKSLSQAIPQTNPAEPYILFTWRYLVPQLALHNRRLLLRFCYVSLTAAASASATQIGGQPGWRRAEMGFLGPSELGHLVPVAYDGRVALNNGVPEYALAPPPLTHESQGA